ncbi:uncharacterized protein B0T15DRAFT_395473, partial [Chaetomium strumarium]
GTTEERRYLVTPPCQGSMSRNMGSEYPHAHHRAVVPIRDIRGRECDFTLRTHSFAALPGVFCTTPSLSTTSGDRHATDFDDPLQVSARYIPRVKALLLNQLPGATDVAVFDHTVRKASATKTPARQVRKIHIDQSPRGALGRARRHLDQQTASMLESGAIRFSIINVWKSIRGTVTDHPLTFADCRSLRQSDLVPVRQIYPDYVGETYALKHRSTQEFWYWSNMGEADVLLLQCFDSLERDEADGVDEDGDDGLAYAQCAHGSFELNEVTGEAEKHERESIEVRCLVIYGIPTTHSAKIT